MTVEQVVGKVNVDNLGDISMKYGVRNIPTILFLKNGEVVDKSVGAVPEERSHREIGSAALIRTAPS